MQQNTNTYGHESRQRRPYNPSSSYNQFSSKSREPNSNSYNSNASPEKIGVVAVENNFPSLSSFPSLGSAKIHPTERETTKGSGRFDILEEVIDVSNTCVESKPKFSYSSMAAKVSEAPMKKIMEDKKTVKKSNKIDTKGKKVYMTQQQYLYDGHKYNTDDIVIIDENGQEIYYSDDDGCNCESDNESEDGNTNEAW